MLLTVFRPSMTKFLSTSNFHCAWSKVIGHVLCLIVFGSGGLCSMVITVTLVFVSCVWNWTPAFARYYCPFRSIIKVNISRIADFYPFNWGHDIRPGYARDDPQNTNSHTCVKCCSEDANAFWCVLQARWSLIFWWRYRRYFVIVAVGSMKEVWGGTVCYYVQNHH